MFGHNKELDDIAKQLSDMTASKLLLEAKLEEALTPMLIQKMWIEKWRGDVPTYQSGAGGMNMLMQIPSK